MSKASVVQLWLAQLVGEWAFELVTTDDVSTISSIISAGSETVWRVGDSWVVAELKGTVDDGAGMHSVTTIGFDTKRERVRGVVAGTMAPVLFELDGDLDASGTRLLLETEGPALTEGKMTDQYRDVHRVIDIDHRELVAQVRTDDGTWKTFMTTRYTRRP